jgi:hypothetical protein
MALPFEGSPGADAAFDSDKDYPNTDPYEIPPLRFVDHPTPGPCTAISLDDGLPESHVPPCTTSALGDKSQEEISDELITITPFGIPEGYVIDQKSGVYAINPADKSADHVRTGGFKDPEGMVRDIPSNNGAISPVNALKRGQLWDSETGRFKN